MDGGTPIGDNGSGIRTPHGGWVVGHRSNAPRRPTTDASAIVDHGVVSMTVVGV